MKASCELFSAIPLKGLHLSRTTPNFHSEYQTMPYCSLFTLPVNNKWLIWLLTLLLCTLSFRVWSDSFNGFDVSRASIDISLIKRGGPPRDGIPALTRPTFISAEQADYLSPKDRVIGISFDGVAKAYPIKILNWHEIVNDQISSRQQGSDKNRSVAVTYCPLCGTGMVFDTSNFDTNNGAGRQLGVSGLLYNSDVLLYDKESESLWSQIMQEAIAGPAVGQKLALLPSTHTTWQQWREKHPSTRVLSRQTGFNRRYNHDPYANYARTPGVMFPVSQQNNALAVKSWVLGLNINQQQRAYPFETLAGLENGTLIDTLGNETINIHFDKSSQSATVFNSSGEQIPAISAYWFAWFAFFPKTEIYQQP